MTTVEVTRQRSNRSPLWTGSGYEWKWTYHLPERQVTTSDGRVLKTKPGGFSTKAETVELARRLYADRPLTLAFPDGTTKELKR